MAYIRKRGKTYSYAIDIGQDPLTGKPKQINKGGFIKRRMPRQLRGRHTHASILISEGVDIVKISRRLGHANPKITLEFYVHLLPNEIMTLQTFFTKPSKVTLNNRKKSCGQIAKKS